MFRNKLKAASSCFEPFCVYYKHSWLPLSSRSVHLSTDPCGSDKLQYGCYRTSQSFCNTAATHRCTNDGSFRILRRLKSTDRESGRGAVSSGFIQHKSSPDDFNVSQALIVRQAIDNGYLSWMRNTYLCMAVGGAFSMSPRVDMFDSNLAEMVQIVGGSMYLIALMNLTYGTVQYAMSTTASRAHTRLATPTLLLSLSFAVVHYLIATIVLYTLFSVWAVEDDERTARAIDEEEIASLGGTNRSRFRPKEV